MKYLITCPDFLPYLTDHFTVDTDFANGMIVFDLTANCYTTDGCTWVGLESESDKKKVGIIGGCKADILIV